MKKSSFSEIIETIGRALASTIAKGKPSFGNLFNTKQFLVIGINNIYANKGTDG